MSHFEISKSSTMDSRSMIFTDSSPSSVRKFDPEMVSISSEITSIDFQRTVTLPHIPLRNLDEDGRSISTQSLTSVGSQVSRTSVLSKLFRKKKARSPSVGDLLQPPEVDTRRISDAYRLQIERDGSPIHLRDSQTVASRHASIASLFGEDTHESFGRSLTALSENIVKCEHTDSLHTPLRRTDINPFGIELEDEKLEEVYKATIGCLISRTPIDNSLPKERYLMKAFRLNKTKHRDLQQKAEKEQKPDVSLHVKVIEADHLMARKGHGKSDPYCKLAVIPSAHVNNLRVDLTDLRKSRQVEELIISHTDVRECTLEPQWNKEFTVQLDNVESASLAVEIWDSEHKISLRKIKGFKGLKNYLKDLKGGNDFLGKTNIPLKDICSGGSSDWYNLFSHRGNPRGRVHLKVAIDIKMKGVPLEVALDYYEKLFEVFCMTRATSTKSASNPDLLGQMPEDSMFAEDWSAELGAIPDQFLSLFASRHGITEMQQAIVKLGSLMKYHLLYRISTNAFQKLYAVVLAQQDQLDLSETGLAQPEVMKVVQKLAACTKSLSQDIHTTIRRHPCEVSLTNQFEVDQFRQQIILLKNLHSITCLVEQREEHINELKDVVTEEIKEACSEWYSQTLRRAMKEATHSNSANPNNRVISFLSTVQTVVVYMGLSRDTLQPIFHQLEINYYESVYMAIESKLADELNSIVAEGPIRDVHSGYILYLGLKEFQAMSIHIEENKHAQLKLPGFHRHFKGMVKSWIDLASQRLKEGIVKAASKLAEETVTELSLFSANARDLIDLVAMICDFWKKLSWPDPLESYEFLMHLVGKLSNGVIIFAEETCAQLVQKDFFGQQPGIFTVTQKLCIALNDIEQVRRGMHELPEFVSLRRLKDELQDKGEALADEVENNTSNILTTMDNKIFAILTTVCTQIIEKMRPDIKRGFKSVSEARKHDDFDSMTTPLMGYLHGNLQELRSNVFHSVFLKFLSGLWPVIVERIEKYTSERHKDNIRSLYFCNLLHVLYEFFHAEGEGLSNEDLETHQYKKLRDILMYRTMATEKLLQCYYQDLVAFQANAPSTRGIIDLHVSYMKEKQVIDLTLIRATGLPPLSIHNSCDCYMKISAVPESFFPNAQRMKSEVYRRNLDPVFEAEFALPAREYTLNNPGAAVLVEVYSYDHLKSHVPIGVVVVACKDIPVLAPSTVPEEEELVVESPKRKTLELPIIVPCQTMALTELQERSDGGEALKRIKRLMQSGKKVPSGSSKTLNGIKSKKLFRLRKS